MEGRELETFVTLAEELHFGRTAERLHISRARVSQLIQKLERQIGGALFERTSRRVDFTPLGRQLHQDLEPAYHRIQEGVSKAIATAGGVRGELRIGFVGAAAGALLLEIMEAFRDRYPGCDIQISEIQVGEVFKPLRDRSIDILITRFPVAEPDLTAGPVVISEAMYVAVAANHPLAGRESVSLNDLTGETFITAADTPGYATDGHVPPRAPDGTPLRRLPQARTFLHALAQISTGKYVTLVGDQVNVYYARPDLAYIPVRDAERQQFGLIWRTADAGHLIRTFAQVARQAAEGTRG